MRAPRMLSLAALLLFASIDAPPAPEFNPGCIFPPGLTEERPIDRTCGLEGQTASAAHRAQNRAKNNFCAPEPVLPVVFADFANLQDAVRERGIPFGGGGLPADRRDLHHLIESDNGELIGEGMRVRFTGYILHARYSNTGKGETVNCKKRGAENNDIHLDLARKATAEPCDTITAEISPHRRPDAWTPANLRDIGRRPVRVTGNLFFDASHVPCTEERVSSPARASSWEIHPVYALDVCWHTTTGRCPADDDSVWTPLDEWLNLEEDLDEP
ncbi:MAG: hypothetical protein ACRD6R_08420 [Candidatus Polarisedimenticolia bacterium]